MEKLTAERAVELHRKLWNYIADRTKQEQRFISKPEALRALGFEPEEIRAQCFCCEYANQNRLVAGIGICVLCPLKWPFTTCSNWAGSGLYDQYEQAVHKEHDWDRAAWFARYIAEVPAKYEEG